MGWKEQAEAIHILQDICVANRYFSARDLNRDSLLLAMLVAAGIGSVSSQCLLGHELNVAYVSRVLTKAKRNYSAI